MQDLHTGDMHPLSDDVMKAFMEIPSKPPSEMEQQLADAKSRLQLAADRVIPIREHQGPTFFIGEEITLKGGKFRVQAITEKRLYLDSISTK